MAALGVDLSGSLYTVHPEDMRLPLNILNSQHNQWLRDVIRIANPEITVIDVFREIHNADENDSTEMKIVGDIIVDIFRGRSLILVHHSKKIHEDVIVPDPASVSRGSSYLTGKVDSLWLLYHNRLYIQSRTSEPQTIKLVQSPSGLWERAKLS
jgi:AAA domain